MNPSELSTTPPQKMQAWGKLIWFWAMGAVLVVLSCFEGSFVWAWYCFATSFLATVAGLSGSRSLADRVEGISPGPPISTFSRIIGDLMMFWVPAITMLALSLLLLDTLAEVHRPRSASSGPLAFLEGMAFYFCWIGAAWSGVWRRSRTPDVSNQ